MADQDVQSSATPFKDAIDRLATGDQGLTVGAGVENGKPAVGAEVNIDVGRPGGWSTGGIVKLVRDMGATAWGYVRWRPK